MMNLNELRDKSYEIACKHGFHDAGYSDEYMIMLAMSGLINVMKAHKRGAHISEDIMEKFKGMQPDEIYLLAFNYYTKETVEISLANTLIRLFDLAGARSIDLNLKPNGRGVESLDSNLMNNISKIFRSITDKGFTLEGRVSYAVHNLIRLCNKMGIDIEWLVTEKMKYNNVKEYKY